MSNEQQPCLVMCRPDHFEVSYAINPWMDPDAWASDRDKLMSQARHQWEALYRNLTDHGASVVLHTPESGVPDMVFTANAAVVLDGKALLARFLDEERRLEEPHFQAFFEGLSARGLLREVATLPDGMYQEGAGDCTWDVARQLFWAGFGQRSTREACDRIEDFFGRRVVPLELVNPRYYHIDTCLAALPSGHIVYYPPAFSDDGIEQLTRCAGGEEWLIEADAEDAEKLAVNMVCLGKRVIMAECSRELDKRLRKAGYRVVRSALPAFGMSGGAAFCLTLRINHRSGQARIGVAA